MTDIDVLLLHIPFFQLFENLEMLPLMLRILNEMLEQEYFGIHNVNSDIPSFQVTDTGLLSIAAYLEREGISVAYFCPYPEVLPSIFPSIAFNGYLEKLKSAIEVMNPKIIGAGPYTNRYPSTLAIFRFIKRFFPNIHNVIGGQHATFMDVQTLRDSHNIDIVVRGEGENIMLQLTKNLLRNKALDDVSGITYRADAGRIRKNPQAPPIKPSDIPIPAYNILPSWIKERNLILNVATGRGCPYNCLFCTERNFWETARIRPAKNVLDELRLVHERKPSVIRFADDTFTWNERFVSELSKLVSEEGLKFQSLHFWTRVDQINDERIENLKKMSDNVCFCLGLESASYQVLKEMRKGITFEQSINACKKIMKQGTVPSAFWIVGHPGSSSKEEEISYKGQKYLMKHKLCMLHETSVFVPYPGSEPFVNPKKYGVELLSNDWSKFCENPHTFPPASCLKQLNPVEIFHYYVNRYLLNIQMLSEHFGYSWQDLSEKAYFARARI